MFTRPLNQPAALLEQAIKQARRGSSEFSHAAGVVGKAEESIDDFVGAVVNISHDNGERDVSRLGDELAWRARKATRYLSRADQSREVATSATGDSAGTVDEVLGIDLALQDREALEAARKKLQSVVADARLGSEIAASRRRLNEDAQPHLEAVLGDGPGLDVSEHGKPLAVLFDQSVDSLLRARPCAEESVKGLDQAISLLETVRERLV